MAAQSDTAQSLRNLFGILENLKLESSYDAIQRGLQENAALKEEVARREVDHRSHLRSITGLQIELDREAAKAKEKEAEARSLKEASQNLTKELETERAKVGERDKQLDERARAITDLKKRLGSAQTKNLELQKTYTITCDQKKEADARLEQATKNFKAKSAEATKAFQGEAARATMLAEQLALVKQFSVELTSPSNEVIKHRLRETFEAAHAFATRFFGEDLGNSVVEDSAMWKDLKERIKWLPLIRSNTPDAKRMRIAACVGALGSMLAGIIFVPVYLEPDMGDVKSLLTDLYMTDKPREQHLRSVLLSTSVDTQVDIRRDRVRQIAETIWFTFGRLIEEEGRKTAFKEDLMQMCTAAAECWDFVRRARVKVDTIYPAFEDTEETAEQFTDRYWLPIPLAMGKDASQRKDSPKQNGHTKHNSDTTSNASGRHKQNGPVHETARDEELQGTFDHKSIRRPVWPGFYVDDELVKGYVLLNSQVKTAREELGPQRIQRQTRRNSLAQPKTHFLC